MHTERLARARVPVLRDIIDPAHGNMEVRRGDVLVDCLELAYGKVSIVRLYLTEVRPP